MATTAVVERTARTTPPAGRWDRIAAWSALAVLALVCVGGVALGEREVPVRDLRAAIAAGDVTEVRMSDDDVHGIGYGPVTIRWRQHGLAYVTTVTQASDERQARKVQRPRDEVVVGGVADALTTGGRQVEVVGSTPTYYAGTSTTIFGFRAPGWLAIVGLAMVPVTLLLVGSTEPWRATRWGWAWLVLLTPIGMPLFLLFGGLTGLWRPRPGSHRLTGGWAFLLALLVFTPES